ncbi:hypothetical protein AUQ37_05225 [Candidatus Methanomethylophilus sp. 1R26]|nr:DNA-3-methyladenine glycosylase [Candidatus Methanomethylophilus sp. 1R26]KUE74291.1 hypothetical protein AUQ37_05225 [Candidatus Methanomethylophilus sp. 1R26]
MPELAGPEFYLPGAAELAPRILGMLLCRRMPDGSVLKLRVTETEAYCGESDTAAHAHHGRTPRTEVLYHRGGKAYVYRCYMFWLLNLTCGAKAIRSACSSAESTGSPAPAACRRRCASKRASTGRTWCRRTGCGWNTGTLPKGG